TNASGIASCSVTPVSAGPETLTATFAGSAKYVASNASIGFQVLATAATATATRTATATSTATATRTATRTATPTATATPVFEVGPIYAVPPELDFGSWPIGRRGDTLFAFLFNPWWND